MFLMVEIIQVKAKTFMSREHFLNLTKKKKIYGSKSITSKATLVYKNIFLWKFLKTLLID